MLVRQGGLKEARLVIWLAAGIKEHTKSQRQSPSDRDKCTICKTRTAEVFMVGVWTGRVKTHLCFCQQRLEFSHSQMAAAGAVLICLSGEAKIDNCTPWCQKLHISRGGCLWLLLIGSNLNGIFSWIWLATLNKVFSVFSIKGQFCFTSDFNTGYYH